MSEFIKEQRYIVIKLKDADRHLDDDDRDLLTGVLEKIRIGRMLCGKQPLECVVVESDWPEHDAVWRMVEARCSSSKENIKDGLREAMVNLINQSKRRMCANGNWKECRDATISCCMPDLRDAIATAEKSLEILEGTE